MQKQKMTSKQKPGTNGKRKILIASVTVGIILLIGAILVAYLMLRPTSERDSQPAPQETSTNSTEPPQQAEDIPKEPENGQPYKNEHLGFTLRYPEGWLELECEGEPERVFFASDERGLGNSTPTDGPLCGGGSDFPPQASIQAIDQASAKQVINNATETLEVDGKEAYGTVNVADSSGLRPEGFETTKYVVEYDNSYLEISYNKWPDSYEDSYDVSEESKQKFITTIEETLTFNK